MTSKTKKKTKPEEVSSYKGHKTKKHYLNEVKEREREKELRDTVR